MSRQAAHSSIWRTAEVVFGASLVLGFALQYFQPLSFGRYTGSPVFDAIGLTLLIAGSLIIVAAKRELVREQQPSEPGAPTTHIVTGGPYRFSRNPLYGGLLVCYAGLAFAIEMPWHLILLLPTALAVQIILIRPEEEFLAQTFGDEFDRYRKRVRRWL